MGAPKTPNDPLCPDPTAPRRPRLQFGLPALMMALTVAALTAPLAFGAGTPLGVWFINSLVLAVAPAAVGSAALYSRGRWQTFFLGALAGLMLGRPGVFRVDFSRTLVSGGLFILGTTIVAAACGVAALAARAFVEHRGWNRADDR